jgi:hypothetical protein
MACITVRGNVRGPALEFLLRFEAGAELMEMVVLINRFLTAVVSRAVHGSGL